MMRKIYHFAENYGSAFLVVTYPLTQLLFHNNTAKKLYGFQDDSSVGEIYRLFEGCTSTFESILQEEHFQHETVIIENVETTTHEDKSQLVNISVGFFNEEKTELFIELTPKSDTRMEMAMYQIDHSLRPEAIINFDENLSLRYGNKAFYELLKSHESTSNSSSVSSIFGLFLPEMQQFHEEALKKTLNKQNTYSFKSELFSLNGKRKWYLFECVKRTLDNSGVEKIFVYLTNVEKQVAIEAEHSYFKQYLGALQELTSDVLFRVEIKNKILFHTLDSEVGKRLGTEISNYVEVFLREKVIHPEDTDLYQLQINEFLSKEGQKNQYPIRFSFFDDSYQWYVIKGKQIYDNQGNLIEIIGAMVNVEKEEQLKEECSSMNQYFEALQSISGEAFYRIDVNRKLLTQTGQVAEELGFYTQVPDFPESVYHMVHPEDLDIYKNFATMALQGAGSRIEVRFQTTTGEYQWYEKESVIIRDEVGKVTEIVGKMNNIHHEKTMEQNFSTLNQHFSAMQEFSNDILYRVDVPTMTLYHTLETTRAKEIGTAIPDYLNTLITKEIVHPEDASSYLDYVKNWYEGKIEECQVRFSLVSSEYEWYKVKGKKIFDAKGDVVEVVGTLVNIQKERELQAEYSLLDQYFLAMQELTPDILFHIDVKTKTLRHNDKNVLKKGIPPEIPDFVETFIKDKRIAPEEIPRYREDCQKLLAGEVMAFKVKIAVNVGEYELFQVRGRFIYDEKGEPLEVFGKIKNIQETVNLQQRASQDLMTGALNKVTFEQESANILKTSKEHDQHALIFIDLDDFKGVNDTLGHSSGDALLCIVVERLKKLVRGNDLVGRIGGDEFAVLLRNIDSPVSAATRTNVFLDSLREPFVYAGNNLSVKASIGVSVFPLHGEEYGDLIHKSDIAVYQSKRKGKNVVTLYADEMEDY